MKQYINVSSNKSSIFVRELVDGKEQQRKVFFKPHLFTSCSEQRATGRDLFGGFVERKNFENTWEMKNYIKEYSDIEGMKFWGTTDPVSQFIFEEYKDHEEDLSALRISYLDIEVNASQKLPDGTIESFGFPDADSAAYPVNAIGQYDSLLKKYIIFSTAAGWTKEKSQLDYKDSVIYVYCKDELELFRKWLSFYQKYTPAIITGWNVIPFDIPYLINRMKKILSEDEYKKLSPWNIIHEKEIKNKFGASQISYNIIGVAVIDYLDLYKKYRHIPRRKYTLDYIAKKEKVHNKLHFKGSHGELFYNNPAFFVDYNAQDVNCVKEFEDKLNFLRLISYLSYYSGVNFEDNFSPIKIWETLIYRTCAAENVAVPIRTKRGIKEEYEGAYVVEPIPGLKELIVSIDASSEYPNAIITWNISPETLVSGQRREKILEELRAVIAEHNDTELLSLLNTETSIIDYYVNKRIKPWFTDVLHKNNVGMAPNWQFYDNTADGIVTILSKRLFAERKDNKKTSQTSSHNVQKIEEEMKRRGIKF